MERSALLERICLRERDQVWRLFTVNPYGLRIQRGRIYNLVDTYFAKEVDFAPRQLERTWIMQ